MISNVMETIENLENRKDTSVTVCTLGAAPDKLAENIEWIDIEKGLEAALPHISSADIVVVYIALIDGQDLESLHTIVQKQYKLYNAKKMILVTDILPIMEENVKTYSELFRQG